MGGEIYKQGRRVTIIGLAANVALTLFKFAAGIVGHSQVMIADAVHSLSDFVSDSFVLLGLKYAQLPPDETHHYGHARYETFATLLVGIMLVLAGLGIGYTAVESIIDRTVEIPQAIALYGAGISIVTKEILYHYTARAGRKLELGSLVANAWHHRTDAISSVVALAGIAVAHFLPQFAVADPIMAVAVGAYIIKVGLVIVRQQFDALSDSSPDEETYRELLKCIEDVEGVIDFHNCKARLMGNMIFVHVDIEVDPKLNIVEAHEISRHTKRSILECMNKVGHVTIHVDPYDPDRPRTGDKTKALAEQGLNDPLTGAEIQEARRKS